MANIQPYYVVPLLIEQPTWGGKYIAEYKHISESEILDKKIGQAYELAQETQLSTVIGDRDFLFAEPNSLDKTKQFGTAGTLQLSELIKQAPELVLGKRVVEKHGAKMPLLIKFTQAQSNSYQVHVKHDEQFNHWLPKPESWYFFEKGKATLGLKDVKKVAEYKNRCLAIYQKAQEISAEITSGKTDLIHGTQELQTFIDLDHPSNYVNVIYPKADSVIDLSEGGTHHSWETDDNVPNGNIVYEVQLDVKDDFCTLRSFDQGKFKDSGELRSLTIEDYFKALDISEAANNPSNFTRSFKGYQENGATISQLFASQYYGLTKIAFSQQYEGVESTTSEGFHHLFVKSGNLVVHTDQGDFPLQQGWSLFIPASVGKYQLTVISENSTKNPDDKTRYQAEVLKTTA